MIKRLRQLAIWIGRSSLHQQDLRGDCRPYRAADLGQLVLRLRQRQLLLCFMIQIVTGICLALVYVPVGRPGLHQPGVFELSTAVGLVSARHAQLGFKLHGRDHVGPSYPGLSFGAFKYPREMT